MDDSILRLNGTIPVELAIYQFFNRKLIYE